MSAGSTNFPVGNNTTYRPVLVNFSAVTAPGNLTATQLNGFHPQIAASGLNSTIPKVITPYWKLTSGGVSGTFSATFNFASADIPSGALPVNFVVRHYNNPIWTTNGAGLAAGASMLATGISTFGDFALGETTGLPTISSQPSATNVCAARTRF